MRACRAAANRNVLAILEQTCFFFKHLFALCVSLLLFLFHATIFVAHFLLLFSLSLSPRSEKPLADTNNECTCVSKFKIMETCVTKGAEENPKFENAPTKTEKLPF